MCGTPVAGSTPIPDFIAELGRSLAQLVGRIPAAASTKGPLKLVIDRRVRIYFVIAGEIGRKAPC